MGRMVLMAATLACLTFISAACGRAGSDNAASSSDAPLPLPAYESALPSSVRTSIGEGFTGDFDAMVARRLVRVGVTYNRTFYFVDNGQQRGIAYEMGKAFEDELNKKRPIDKKVHVYFVPLPRDLLASALKSGKIDLVVAQVTVRPELQAARRLHEPHTYQCQRSRRHRPRCAADRLGGRPVRPARVCTHEQQLSREPDRAERQVAGEGKGARRDRRGPGQPRRRRPAGDGQRRIDADRRRRRLPRGVLEEDLHEPDVHESVVLRSGATLAVAIRKDSPKLAAELNAFIAKFGLGTAFGNILEKRYLVSTDYAKQATSEAERTKFVAAAEFFRKYGQQYDIHYLLMAAQGYQESRLNQKAKSRVGADGDDAGHAGDRAGHAGRRHQAGRRQRPRGRQVRPVHAGQVLQGRTDGRAEQGAVHLRVLQRRSCAAFDSCGPRPRRAAWTRTSGSATSSRSRPSASAVKRSRM